MINKQKILEILNKESVSESSRNNNRIIIEQDFEIIADEIVKLFAIPVVLDTLVCDCEIPKPKSPFIGDYEYDYCRDCDGHISQNNYL